MYVVSIKSAQKQNQSRTSTKPAVFFQELLTSARSYDDNSQRLLWAHSTRGPGESAAVPTEVWVKIE